MSAASDIAGRLASYGFGTAGTNLFVNTKPATPDNMVAVFDYSGPAADYTHDTSGNDHPSVQVWVRNTNAGTARATIDRIYNHLDGIRNTTITTFYAGIFANQTPELMGKDENNRTEWAVNFTTTRRR